MTEADTRSAGGPAPSAMWLWCSTPDESAEVISFVAERQVRTVFLGIGWNGPEPHVITLADRLRAAGVEVQCLGGDNGWLEQPERASQWLDRALSAWRFDGVHLDVAPRFATDWPTATTPRAPTASSTSPGRPA
jgi:hypothetical protein